MIEDGKLMTPQKYPTPTFLRERRGLIDFFWKWLWPDTTLYGAYPKERDERANGFFTGYVSTTNTLHSPYCTQGFFSLLYVFHQTHDSLMS